MLGVGRGSYAFETGRLGVPLDITKEKFDESLAVLQALLTEEEVSWDGKYYQFEPLTIMPRPVRKLPLMMAVMAPERIYECAKRGFHIQTTPLSGGHQHMLNQVDAFTRAKNELGEQGKDLTLSLSNVGFLAQNATDKDEKIALAHHYYSQFDNVFTGPGIVNHGFIEPLPRQMSIEQTGLNLLICTPEEMVEDDPET